jgi:hypothetical protein
MLFGFVAINILVWLLNVGLGNGTKVNERNVCVCVCVCVIKVHAFPYKFQFCLDLLHFIKMLFYNPCPCWLLNDWSVTMANGKTFVASMYTFSNTSFFNFVFAQFCKNGFLFLLAMEFIELFLNFPNKNLYFCSGRSKKIFLVIMMLPMKTIYKLCHVHIILVTNDVILFFVFTLVSYASMNG